MADRALIVFNADLGIYEEMRSGDVASLGSPVDAKGNSLSNLPDPSAPQDAATKAYVDANSGGGGGGGGNSGIIIGRGAPVAPPPAANFLYFDQDTATVYPST